jgi:hypothetical protein
MLCLVIFKISNFLCNIWELFIRFLPNILLLCGSEINKIPFTVKSDNIYVKSFITCCEKCIELNKHNTSICFIGMSSKFHK